MYYVYMISCEGNTLYTGIATNISRRMREHFSQSEKCAKYTRSHKANSLEALWTVADRSTASRLEYRIKRLSRKEKLVLIASPERATELLEETAEITPVEGFSLDEMLA